MKQAIKSEEDILKIIMEKQSWEEIIYYIVSIEKLDPWNIDLVKLANSFIGYLELAIELDFRIPAKVVFVAAILLRIKANYLTLFEEEEESEVEKTKVDLGIEPELIDLGIPIRRMPKRQITLDELIQALKKAVEVKERRDMRRERWIRKVGAEVGEEEDIMRRMERLMEEIEKLMKELRRNIVEFRQLVKVWKRDEIVDRFIPLLHLEQNRKIKTEQKEFFKEIFITKR